MIDKTEAIALNYIKYGESSIIVRMLTRKFGIQSYIVNGVRSPKAKHKISFFQPLTLLDLVVYYHEKKSLQRIAEMKSLYSYRTIPYDIRKTTIALFIAEIIYKTTQEEEQNETLFTFIADSLTYFDQEEEHINNFHLLFLIRLTMFIGIDIRYETENTNMLYGSEQVVFDKLLNNENIALTKNDRQKYLNIILKHYKLHFDTLKDIPSLRVLMDVLN